MKQGNAKSNEQAGASIGNDEDMVHDSSNAAKEVLEKVVHNLFEKI